MAQPMNWMIVFEPEVTQRRHCVLRVACREENVAARRSGQVRQQLSHADGRGRRHADGLRAAGGRHISQIGSMRFPLAVPRWGMYVGRTWKEDSSAEYKAN